MNKIKLLCVILLSSIALPAYSATINFDDLPGQGDFIPNGYNGLDWSNFGNVDTRLVPLSGFAEGTISPFNVGFDGFSDPAFITSNSIFDLNSGYFISGWNDDLQLQVIGSLNGNVLYDMTFILSATDPRLINLNYLGIDSAEFISSGGTPHPEFIPGGSGTNFGVDNLVINQTSSVPDSGSTVMLLGVALSGLDYLRRKLS